MAPEISLCPPIKEVQHRGPYGCPLGTVPRAPLCLFLLSQTRYAAAFSLTPHVENGCQRSVTMTLKLEES